MVYFTGTSTSLVCSLEAAHTEVIGVTALRGGFQLREEGLDRNVLYRNNTTMMCFEGD